MRFDTLFDTPFTEKHALSQKQKALFYSGLKHMGMHKNGLKKFYIFQVLEER